MNVADAREMLKADAAKAWTEDPTRRPALHERATAVNVAIDELEKLIYELRNRLEPVLLPTTPEGAVVDADIAGDEGSWLSDFLTATQSRIGELGYAVRRLTLRLDV